MMIIAVIIIVVMMTIIGGAFRRRVVVALDHRLQEDPHPGRERRDAGTNAGVIAFRSVTRRHQPG